MWWPWVAERRVRSARRPPPPPVARPRGGARGVAVPQAAAARGRGRRPRGGQRHLHGRQRHLRPRGSGRRETMGGPFAALFPRRDVDRKGVADFSIGAVKGRQGAQNRSARSSKGGGAKICGRNRSHRARVHSRPGPARTGPLMTLRCASAAAYGPGATGDESRLNPSLARPFPAKFAASPRVDFGRIVPPSWRCHRVFSLVLCQPDDAPSLDKSDHTCHSYCGLSPALRSFALLCSVCMLGSCGGTGWARVLVGSFLTHLHRSPPPLRRAVVAPIFRQHYDPGDGTNSPSVQAFALD